jgi:hypothetical protein
LPVSPLVRSNQNVVYQVVAETFALGDVLSQSSNHDLIVPRDKPSIPVKVQQKQESNDNRTRC